MCAQSGVQEVRFGELHVIFGGINQSLEKALDKVQTKPDEQKSQEIIKEALAEQKRNNLADQLEELKLTDPLAYEQLIGGDLDGGSSS